MLDNLFFVRKVRDSNPRYDVMRTPHFECGSFDHSDNFPYLLSKAGTKVLLFSDLCKCLSFFSAIYCILQAGMPRFLKSIGVIRLSAHIPTIDTKPSKPH